MNIPSDDDFERTNIGDNRATIDAAVMWSLYGQQQGHPWRKRLEWFIARGYLITEDGDEDATEGRVAAECERGEHGET